MPGNSKEGIGFLNLPELWGLQKEQGKVRDVYHLGTDRLILIATDRLSAFDRVLTHIPGRGQILNLLSAWWFERTADIVPNHVVAIPDPNVMVVRLYPRIPIEMVVRGFLTGSTDTSIWTRYTRGEREFGGFVLPERMKKNMPLPYPVVDSTTKAEVGHDRKLTEAEILEEKIVTPLQWQALKTTALSLFARGQTLAGQAGLFLVDTKYEFGTDPQTGSIVVIDEIHTPDSSRFWEAATYPERFEQGIEPDSYDKEFARLWYTQQGYRGEGTPPVMPEEMIRQVLERYIIAYERLTGQSFEVPESNPQERILMNLGPYVRRS